MTQTKIVISRSLNPTAYQMALIKCEKLKRRFERSGVTPAQLFYGKNIGVNDWIEKSVKYSDRAQYLNNVKR